MDNSLDVSPLENIEYIMKNYILKNVFHYKLDLQCL